MIESTYGEICTVRMDRYDEAVKRFGVHGARERGVIPGHEHQTLNGINMICYHCGTLVQHTNMGPRTVTRIQEWP